MQELATSRSRGHMPQLLNDAHAFVHVYTSIWCVRADEHKTRLSRTVTHNRDSRLADSKHAPTQVNSTPSTSISTTISPGPRRLASSSSPSTPCVARPRVSRVRQEHWTPGSWKSLLGGKCISQSAKSRGTVEGQLRALLEIVPTHIRKITLA